MNFEEYTEAKKLICACSGGVDSMVLAFLIKKFLPKAEVHLLIVNHNLRECSKIEAENTKNALKEYGFKNIEILEWVHNGVKTGIEEKARKIRQKLIFDYAILHSIDTIFLGHHLNDLEENFFLKLGMGAGLFGITSMQKWKRYRYNGYFFNIIRPLLFENKRDILDFAKQNAIFYSEDESNFDDRFTRNRLRKKLHDFDVSNAQFLNTYNGLVKSAEILKIRLQDFFIKTIIFNKNFGFFSAKIDDLQNIQIAELELCFKQIIFYFTEKCEIRTRELNRAIVNILAKKSFTLGGVEVFFMKQDIFFIKEKAKISDEIFQGMWDSRFKICQKMMIELPKLPYKIIATLPFVEKDIEKNYYLSYKIEPVDFIII